ncbi:MAG: hypothetical protein H0T79_19380 [Deltaproteobacteria bacterium]|nr:hypothetical protein [Deltaproteobacteria bacterium]
MAKLWNSAVLSVVVLASATAGGCKDKKADTTPKDPLAGDSGVPKVDPTLCDTNGKNIVTYDLNHDSRPDVWRLYRTEEEGGTKVEFMTCKQVDFDHDNRKDWVVAYNRKGNSLYEKADFDYDGKWDMSTVYDTKSGAVAEVERDTDFDGKFDVRELYDTAGVLSSIRRDRNTDGQPDLWEQYQNGILLAILYDDDFDGKVDRREEIPGARPKTEMPQTNDTASDSINTPAATPAAGSGSSAPAPKKK